MPDARLPFLGYAQSSEKLRLLAHKIVQDPDHLPRHIDETVRGIHAISPDASLTLLFLRKLLTPLIHEVAEGLFDAKINAILEKMPDHERPSFKAYIWKSTIKLKPVERLFLLNKILEERSKKTIDRKSIDGTDSVKP
jgi:hypothetical protein